MSRFVLDASIALAWVRDNPVPSYATRVRQELLRGTRAIVPPLWHLEVANGLAVAERRQILAANDANEALTIIEQLAAGAIETDLEFIAMSVAFSAARLHALSAYDAVYLKLAERLHLPLATLDQPLQDAAARAGIRPF